MRTYQVFGSFGVGKSSGLSNVPHSPLRTSALHPTATLIGKRSPVTRICVLCIIGMLDQSINGAACQKKGHGEEPLLQPACRGSLSPV
jgi:hypothetical protein